MTKKLICILPLVVLLSACTSSNHGDLDAWMSDQTKLQRGRIPPLPEAQKFQPIDFSATVDPFKDRPVSLVATAKENKFAPDLNRRKEPLEQYPLSAIMMVGILERNGQPHALIKAPDNTINYVTVGNYLGTNYGRIVKITETQITLDERMRGGTDEWSSINTTVPLVEEADQKRQR